MGNGSGAVTGGRELPQLLALGFGVVYVLVGLAGFLVTGACQVLCVRPAVDL